MSFRKGVPKINVGRYAGTPIDQLPNSYLRWMLGQDFPKEWLEIARRKVQESPYSNDYINVSRHAYDQYSLRFLGRWMHGAQRKEGIGTFVAREAAQAWAEGSDVSKRRHQDDGIVKLWDNVKWVFAVSPHFPDYKELITVMPSDD